MKNSTPEEVNVYTLQQPEGNVNQNETENKEPYFENKEIEGTPFRAIYIEKEGWSLVLGQHKVTEPKESYEEVVEKTAGIDWMLLLNIIHIAITKINEVTSKI